MRHLVNVLGYTMMYFIAFGTGTLGITVILRASEALKFNYLIGGTFIVFAIFFFVVFSVEFRDYLIRYKQR